MQTLNIDRPNMPDLQFALLITALCTSRLTVLNIPDPLRTKIFDRCWVLIHEGPPPRRPEERVLDLRPWTEVTLEAVVETIRSIFAVAGIRTLTWDHPASEPTQLSTPAAQPLIDRVDRLYPQRSRTSDASGQEAAPDPPDRRHHPGPDVRQLVGEMAALIGALAPALKRRAADLAVSGKDTEVAGKLLKGADAIRDSGLMYLTWARHYAALADGQGEETEETDGSEAVPG
jgi:hypothetical protein